MMKSNGFTLIELLITVVIAVILATLAAPSFVEIIQRNRIATHANELLAALNYARSEAVRLRGDVAVVVVKGSGDEGWVATVNDPDGNPLRVSDFDGTPVSLDAAHTITYTEFGLANPHPFELTHDGSSLVRCIRVIASGRAQVSEGGCS